MTKPRPDRGSVCGIINDRMLDLRLDVQDELGDLFFPISSRNSAPWSVLVSAADAFDRMLLDRALVPWIYALPDVEK